MVARSLLGALLVCGACVPGRVSSDVAAESLRVSRIRSEVALLRPLFDRPPPPGPQDWLTFHAEPGQTFEQYLRAEPRLPDAARRIIYVQPLGELGPGQQALVTKTAEFLGIAYSLQVDVRPAISLETVPPDAQRSGFGSGKQVLTNYVLTTLLAPELPSDAMAMIGLTASDLWPGAYRCVMAGSNGLAELDNTPLGFCPEDLAKVIWATGDDAPARLQRMREFSLREGLADEADFFARAERAIAKVDH